MEKKGNISMGSFILAFITILVGLIFLSPITAAVSDAKVNGSAVVGTLLDLVPLFYVLLVLAVAAVPAIVAYKKAT